MFPVANIPGILSMGGEIADVRLYGQMDEWFEVVPPFFQNVAIPDPYTRFGLFRVFMIELLHTSNLPNEDSPSRYYYTNGRLLITQALSTWERYTGKGFVAISGTQPQWGCKIKSRSSYTASPLHNVSAVPFLKRNGRWVIGHNYLDPNPKFPQGTHIGFDHPFQDAVVPFDGVPKGATTSHPLRWTPPPPSEMHLPETDSIEVNWAKMEQVHSFLSSQASDLYNSYLAIPSVPLTTQDASSILLSVRGTSNLFHSSFRSYVDTIEGIDLKQYAINSVNSDPFRGLAQLIGESDTLLHIIAFACGVPFNSLQDARFTTSPFFWAQAWGIPYSKASLVYSLLTKLPSTSPNLEGQEALALWDAWRSSNTDDTAVRFGKFQAPTPGKLSALHQFLDTPPAPGCRPTLQDALDNPVLTALPEGTFSSLHHTYLEVTSALHFHQLSETPCVPQSTVDRVLQGFTNFELTPEQIKAVETVTKSFALVTGCAGSGKTTISALMAEALTQGGYEVIFTAPTGKAAKRMQESLSEYSSAQYKIGTLHSIFHINPEGYLPAIPSPLEGSPTNKAYIIDESSMLDYNTFLQVYQVVKQEQARVYFLGDINQLPPVGKGTPFWDMLNILPFISLPVSKRSAENSGISLNANRLITGSEVLIPTPDFTLTRSVSHTSDILHLADTLKETYPDVQVVTPYYKASPNRPYTAQELNPLLRRVLNPLGQPLFKFAPGGVKHPSDFCHNDKIIITKNLKLPRYSFDGVSFTTLPDEVVTVNGETGVIVNFLPNTHPSLAHLPLQQTHQVVIKLSEDYLLIPGVFTESAKVFKSYLFHNVDLAYAITVHRAQGSQYSAVIFTMSEGDSSDFVNRNMIYTAITRASKYCALVGSGWEENRQTTSQLSQSALDFLARGVS